MPLQHNNEVDADSLHFLQIWWTLNHSWEVLKCDESTWVKSPCLTWNKLQERSKSQMRSRRSADIAISLKKDPWPYITFIWFKPCAFRGVHLSTGTTLGFSIWMQLLCWPCDPRDQCGQQCSNQRCKEQRTWIYPVTHDHSNLNLRFRLFFYIFQTIMASTGWSRQFQSDCKDNIVESVLNKPTSKWYKLGGHTSIRSWFVLSVWEVIGLNKLQIGSHFMLIFMAQVTVYLKLLL